MRTLVITRGIQASGKSTFIKNNNLEPYTLSSDKIRLMVQSPIMTVEGTSAISQKNDKQVWTMLFTLLEAKMQRGEFVVIDATHVKNSAISKYKELCSKYRYRCVVVDFSNESLETCLKRNREREGYKFVPEDVIKSAYEKIRSEKISNWAKVINPRDFQESLGKYSLTFDFNKYEKVVVFGDIHGCLEPIKEYFKTNYYNKNYFYIFAGDYLDRGLQNVEVFKFIERFSEHKNTLLLEGNHEGHWHNYSYGLDIKSGETKNVTFPQLEAAGIDAKRIRVLTRKLGQMAYFTYGSNIYLITHGGLPTVPSIKTPTISFIKGVGDYAQSKEVDKNWNLNTPNNYYSIHGHRNVYDEEVQNTERTFNICDTVESGGYLRILEITKDVIEVPDGNWIQHRYQSYHKTIKIKNNFFNKEAANTKIVTRMNYDIQSSTLKALAENKYITKKDLGDNIYSFNFSRDVFNKKIWNEQTITARGLFINMKDETIVARSYDKFFNINEVEATRARRLKESLAYPVEAYKKYNGFLGLLSYNKNTDDFFIASKSTNQGDFAGYFKEIIKPYLTDELKTFFRNIKGCTMVFEVIDPINDPHMIKYNKPSVVLLDIIENKFKYVNVHLRTLQMFGKKFGFKVKEIERTFNSWDELHEWETNLEKDFSIEEEGYVITDANKFSFKLKLPFYNFWKRMRSVKDMVAKGSSIKPGYIKTKEETEFYNFLLNQDKGGLAERDIISLRDEFFANGGFSKND